MAATLEEFPKQPGDTITYRFDYRDWLTDMGDTAQSAVVTAETGITVVSSSVASGYVNVKLSGGTDGESYVVTSALTTSGGHVKEAEITIKVKEIP
jgi:hypothetical protein